MIDEIFAYRDSFPFPFPDPIKLAKDDKDDNNDLRFISSHLLNHLFIINFLSAYNGVWLLLLFPVLTLVICVFILQTACGKLYL